MTDHKNGALEQSHTAQRGALTTRGAGDLAHGASPTSNDWSRRRQRLLGQKSATSAGNASFLTPRALLQPGVIASTPRW